MPPSSVLVALIAIWMFCVPTQTVADSACKPVLAFTEVRFSGPQNQQRTWTGILSVDAARCATISGLFEIKFVRLKEMGPDLLFTERFTWRPGLIQVSLDFWWDESVGDFWIGGVLPCGCATEP
jgi:hypothetical protein